MKAWMLIAVLTFVVTNPIEAACARGDRPVLTRVKTIVTAPFRLLGRVRGRGC